MTIRAFEGSIPRIHHSAWIDPLALVLGEVAVGEDASVWPMAVARGDVQRIEIGARTNIQDGCVLHVSHDSIYKPGGTPLILGSDITVGHKAVLHACTVEDGCFIGIGSTVLDGARIGARAMLGAGALVPPGKTLEGCYLWLGQPVRRARALTDDELEYMAYSARHYVKLKDRHQQG
jgi:carbonic anhydrase/acetyltransferase-like protein (isoleucine patch superfamily)